MQSAAIPTALLTDEDAQHLRLLSVFHYLLAGLTTVFSLFPLLHLAIGIGMLTGRLNDGNALATPDQRLAGGFFIAIATGLIVSGLSLAGLLAYAGRCLQHRRRHLLCMIVAGLSCLMMPFGTVLGVFSLVVLSRPSVKAAFQA